MCLIFWAYTTEGEGIQVALHNVEEQDNLLLLIWICSLEDSLVSPKILIVVH